MGKRNPVTLVSAVVKRNSAVAPGNLCEANSPPTTISPLPIATRVIMTCKTVKAPTDIPRIMAGSVVARRSQTERVCYYKFQLQQGFDQGESRLASSFITNLLIDSRFRSREQSLSFVFLLSQANGKRVSTIRHSRIVFPDERK